MKEHVKYVDRLAEVAGKKHSKLFPNVRFGKKWRQSQGEASDEDEGPGKRIEKLHELSNEGEEREGVARDLERVQNFGEVEGVRSLSAPQSG